MLRLQTGVPGAAPQAWKRICEASRREFQAIYDRLGVRLTERGESAYNPLLRPLVEELQERGIAEDSDGAKVPARRRAAAAGSRAAAADYVCCAVGWAALSRGLREDACLH
jgi:arginyl-tRNA synthetase